MKIKQQIKIQWASNGPEEDHKKQNKVVGRKIKGIFDTSTEANDWG